MISNWPGYVDPGKDNSLAKFTDRTGVEIEYIEDINDNAAFFGKVQPLLDQGESGDRSIMVVTDWMAKQMYDLGYLQEVDHDDLPTVFENIRPGIRSSELDPDRKYAHPVAERHDRDLGGHRGGARHHLDQRPLRPQVQGPRDDAHRDARHRAAGDEGRRRRSRQGDHRGVDGRGRQDPSGGRRRADPALHRERLHRGHHERERRGLDRVVRRRAT